MQTATPTALQPGQTVGAYTIESVIASGGMGTVYRARKAMLDKVVALKVLHPSIAPEQEHLQRFLREAKVSANLDHPAVIKVFDVGSENSLYFMAMEFVDGTDLKSLVAAHGPFSSRKALRIVRQVAEVLAYAHDKGLIHRDVKPANILITSKNEAKLGDFGLARLCRDNNEVTMAGTILGTPAFMSPEQCRGDTLDGRTDLYSLGATLYYLLSGKLPFVGDKPSLLIYRVINEPPPPLKRLVPDLADNVVELVQRLMAKFPHARFADGYEVAAAIDEVLVGRGVSAASSNPRSAVADQFDIPWGKVTLATAAAAMVGLGAYFAIGPTDDSGASGGTGRAFAQGRTTGGVRSGGHVMHEAPRDDPAAASVEAEFQDLQREATNFITYLSTGALDKIDGYLDAGVGTSVDRRREVKELFDTVVARRMESVKYRSRQSALGHASTVVTFTCPQTGESLTYTITWTRPEDVWYVERIDQGEVE